MIVITLQTCAFPSCCGYLNIVQCPGITWKPCEVYAKFIKHLSVQEGLKITMFGHFTICEVLTSYCSVCRGKKTDTVVIMTTNQPRPRTRLSLRSNTTVPYGSMSSEQPDSDAPSMQTTIISQTRSYIAVAVLCYINLLNYMDRYTIAGECTVIKAISSGIVHRKSL